MVVSTARRLPTGEGRTAAPAVLILVSVTVLAASVASGVGTRTTPALVLAVTAGALLAHTSFISWQRLLQVLILFILFVPIRRYVLPAQLPFQLEPYRVFVALLVVGWCASLLVDPRIRFRRTGLEGPVVAILGGALVSVIANPGRVAQVSAQVDKKLTFTLSFVLVLYVIVSTIHGRVNVDRLVSTLVGGGTIVGFLALVEARTGFNVFNHLSQVIPVLRNTGDAGGPDMLRYGSARLRVFGSAQHPIALSAALVMLLPLALYLARRSHRRRWLVCALVLFLGAASTVSRTGVLMVLVVAVVYLWLRTQATVRLWPALLPALIIVHFAIPGTLGALKNSFQPPGGLVGEQQQKAGEIGSGRLADIAPALDEWKQDPLVGQGFGTRVVDSSAPVAQAQILDDQWLTTLLETGAVGFCGWLWLFVRVVRRFGAAAKRDDSLRGWLLTAITAGVAAYGVGMLTFDAFSFTQVTFLLFMLIGLGSALLADSVPLAAVVRVPRPPAPGVTPVETRHPLRIPWRQSPPLPGT